MARTHDWVFHGPDHTTPLRGSFRDLTRLAKGQLGPDDRARVDRDGDELVFWLDHKGHVTYPHTKEDTPCGWNTATA